jgi:hypothetical protein
MMPGMSEVPPLAVRRAAAAFGLDVACLRRLGGNSGSAWGAGSLVLRVGTRPGMEAELAAATAAAGMVPVPRVRDRARSWAILNLDPAALARQAHPGWRELTRGRTGNAGLDTIPGWARAWACRFMLADLAHRYSPADLAHVRDAQRHAEAAT